MRLINSLVYWPLLKHITVIVFYTVVIHVFHFLQRFFGPSGKIDPPRKRTPLQNIFFWPLTTIFSSIFDPSLFWRGLNALLFSICVTSYKLIVFLVAN